MCTGTDEEDAIRLDNWFKLHFPGLSYGRLKKLLRTGQVRVDGRRAKAGLRLEVGQSVRIPPIIDLPVQKKVRLGLSEADRRFVESLVIHKDPDVLVIDKPAGLAVQGGSGVVQGGSGGVQGGSGEHGVITV